MDLGLRGKTALVCASTAGLGRATAEALAAEGAHVAVSGRRGVLAREVAGALPGAVAVECDVTEPGAAHRLFDEVVREMGRSPDIVVLNGPGPKPAAAQDISANELRSAFEALMVFHQELVEVALPPMRERRWGRILAISSSSVVEPIAGLALSSIGRAALAAYLKTLAAEVASAGITVNLVLPGRIDTDRVRALDEAAGDGARKRAVAAIPAGRYGDTAEFGAVAAFLCSEQAAYVTGVALRIDGGAAKGL